MLRGSRLYASPVSGSWMKKLTMRVLRARNGSRYAVVGSGNSDMSDSWIAWKPRIEEPSKFRPLSKTDWSNDDTGTVKCCMIPGRSQNRTSTISTPSSWMYFSSSSLFANMDPPWPPSAAGACEARRGGRGQRGVAAPPCLSADLRASGYPVVSRLFRECNGPRRRRPRPSARGSVGWGGERDPGPDPGVRRAAPRAARDRSGVRRLLAPSDPRTGHRLVRLAARRGVHRQDRRARGRLDRLVAVAGLLAGVLDRHDPRGRQLRPGRGEDRSAPTGRPDARPVRRAAARAAHLPGGAGGDLQPRQPGAPRPRSAHGRRQPLTTRRAVSGRGGSRASPSCSSGPVPWEAALPSGWRRGP